MLANQNADTIKFSQISLVKKIVRPIKTLIRQISREKNIVCSKGPITWSIFNPGVELSPVDRVEILYDYMEDFNPEVEMLYIPAIGSNKKADGCRKYETYIAMFVFSQFGVLITLILQFNVRTNGLKEISISNFADCAENREQYG